MRVFQVIIFAVDESGCSFALSLLLCQVRDEINVFFFEILGDVDTAEQLYAEPREFEHMILVGSTVMTQSDSY